MFNTRKIRLLMEEKKISNKEIGELIGMHEKTIGDIFRSGSIKVRVLEKISKALGVPMKYWFDEAYEFQTREDDDKRNELKKKEKNIDKLIKKVLVGQENINKLINTVCELQENLMECTQAIEKKNRTIVEQNKKIKEIKGEN